MDTLKSGDRIHNHLLLEKLGEGGYGEVWKSEYFGTQVALKVFTKAERLANIRNEIVAQYRLGRLDGPDGRYFPRVEHIDVDASPPYMRMELVAGVSLEVYQKANPRLLAQDRLALAKLVLEGLAVVHRLGFVHGDLSPGNILVTSAAQVKIIDVGFGAVFQPTDQVERSGDAAQVLGAASPSYAAPERGRLEFRQCGKQCDIFSFGKILYHLLTGREPHTIVPLTKHLPGLVPEWDEFLFRCVEDLPENRFADAHAALEAFNAALSKEELDAVPNSFVAECPSCRTSTLIPEQWLGREFECKGCHHRLEVIYFDVEGGRAEVRAADGDPTFTVSASPLAACPGCGEPVDPTAGCSACIPRTPRAAAASAGPEHYPLDAPLREEDFGYKAAIAFLLFPLLWVPGAVATAYFLSQAKEFERREGRLPTGTTSLVIMMWFLVYLPMALVGLAGFFTLLSGLP
ncbi:MAG TPA: protein kinase [Planctomycetota bacterium]|nr:protein kinase [Planctomycetota bacterium]